MSKIYINGNRSGYSPEQCGRTLTAQQLINILSGFDPDAPVYLKNDGGYTYGAITDWDIDEKEDTEEDEGEEC